MRIPVTLVGSPAAATLECRAGKRDSLGRIGGAFAACSSPYSPTLTPSATGDGAYRAEFRIRSGASVSEPVGLNFYLHRSLEGAGDCTLRAPVEALFEKAQSVLEPDSIPPCRTLQRASPISRRHF